MRVLTGVHCTWLARDGRTKAPVDTQRKAMGDLLGHAVRFRMAKDVMAAGEGNYAVVAFDHGVSSDMLVRVVDLLRSGRQGRLRFILRKGNSGPGRKNRRGKPEGTTGNSESQKLDTLTDTYNVRILFRNQGVPS